MEKTVFDLLHDKLEDVSSKSGSSPSYADELVKYTIDHQIIYFSSQELTNQQEDTAFLLFGRNRYSNRLEAQSIKSSNVAFNFVNLLRAAGSGLLGIAGAVTNPMLLITAILLVITDLYDATKIEFTDPIAHILKATWELRYAQPITEEILKRTNLLLAEDGLAAIDETTLIHYFDILEHLKCIMIEDNQYFVVEVVHIKQSGR